MQFHRFRRHLVLLTAALILLFAYDSGVSKAQPDAFVYLPLLTATDTRPKVHAINIDNATMQFYTVEGANEDEIRAGIDDLRPGDYDAQTDWQFEWFVPDDGYGSCNLDGVTVDYAITVIFPQWTPPAQATAALIEQWNDYIDALAVHESGHVERVVPNIPELYEAIKESSCDSFDAAAQEWLDAIDQINSEYDADTDHGATQGAVFP